MIVFKRSEVIVSSSQKCDEGKIAVSVFRQKLIEIGSANYAITQKVVCADHIYHLYFEPPNTNLIFVLTQHVSIYLFFFYIKKWVIQ